MMHSEPKPPGDDRDPASPSAQSRLQDGDPEWVADLFDTLHDGDLDATLAGLESLLRTIRKAAKARRMLAGLQPSLICRGLEVRATRRGSGL